MSDIEQQLARIVQGGTQNWRNPDFLQTELQDRLNGPSAEIDAVVSEMNVGIVDSIESVEPGRGVDINSLAAAYATRANLSPIAARTATQAWVLALGRTPASGPVGGRTSYAQPGPSVGAAAPVSSSAFVPAPQPTWPPPPPGSAYSSTDENNTSGTDTTVPEPINSYKWSWGAFGLPWLWLMNYGMVLPGIAWLVGSILINLLRFGPGNPLIKSLAIAIFSLALFAGNLYLGTIGNQLAWKKRPFNGIDQFLAVETAWKNWSIGLFVFGVVCFCLGVLAAVFAAAHRIAGGS